MDRYEPHHIRFLFIVGIALIIVGINNGVLGLAVTGGVFVAFGVVAYGKKGL